VTDDTGWIQVADCIGSHRKQTLWSLECSRRVAVQAAQARGCKSDLAVLLLVKRITSAVALIQLLHAPTVCCLSVTILHLVQTVVLTIYSGQPQRVAHFLGNGALGDRPDYMYRWIDVGFGRASIPTFADPFLIPCTGLLSLPSSWDT